MVVGNARERKWILEVLVVVLVVKLLALALSVSAWLVIQNQPVDLLSLWNRWDAPHYVDIARYGYTAAGEQRFFIVFPPLFPLFIRLLAFATPSYELAALLVSNFASVLASVYLFKLARLDLPESAALRSVFYFCIFPTAYFLIAGYSESLFLLLTISCIYYARTRRWALAGLAGMLSTATRLTGLALVPALLCELLQQHAQNHRGQGSYNAKAERRKQKWRAPMAILMTFLGFLAYLMLNFAVFGDAFAFMSIEREHWFKHFAPPWVGLFGAMHGIFWREPAEVVLICFAEIFFAFFAVACIVYAMKFRISYCIYMLFSFIAFTSTTFWLSIPRYTLSLFPVFILLASLSKRKDVLHYVFSIAFASFFAFFTILFTQGRWAF